MSCLLNDFNNFIFDRKKHIFYEIKTDAAKTVLYPFMHIAVYGLGREMGYYHLQVRMLWPC